MSKTPLISVVVPFYNGENFVEKTIENFKKQTFSSFELILVDDGSTDSTAQRLCEAKQREKDMSIQVVVKQNGGVSSARNQGIEKASGEWLCFCDDDDVISPDYLSLLFGAVTQGKAKLALGYITKQENELYAGNTPEIKLFGRDEFLREFLYNGIKYSHCGAIFHRSYYDGGVRYPEGEKYSEDVYLLWKLLSMEDTIPVVCHPIYYYYQNPTSAMNKKMTLDRKGAISLMKELEGFIEKQAPEFYPEYKSFAVARHYWSILWQAAGCFENYKEFCAY